MLLCWLNNIGNLFTKLHKVIGYLFTKLHKVIGEEQIIIN